MNIIKIIEIITIILKNYDGTTYKKHVKFKYIRKPNCKLSNKQKNKIRKNKKWRKKVLRKNKKEKKRKNKKEKKKRYKKRDIVIDAETQNR